MLRQACPESRVSRDSSLREPQDERLVEGSARSFDKLRMNGHGEPVEPSPLSVSKGDVDFKRDF
jgi:hypothetical protein